MKKSVHIRDAFLAVKKDIEQLRSTLHAPVRPMPLHATVSTTMAGDANWLKNQRVLVIAPHPDDEVLGCGGFIRKVKKAGGKVFVLCVCVGDVQQYGGASNTDVRLREFKQVMDYLQVDGAHLAYTSDKYHLKLDTIPQMELITLIERGTPVSLNAVNPTVVLLPFQHSSNQDHRAVFEAGFSALRPRPAHLKHNPQVVLCYEQPDVFWGMDKFTPNFFVDISVELEEKIHALSLYKTQIHPHPHPVSLENVKHIANARGIHTGSGAVEAFECRRFFI